jgi:hypothetical protein
MITAGAVQDPRTDRERILDLAKAAGALPEPFRRQAIMGLMRERYRQPIPSAIDPRTEQPPPPTEAAVFYAGCGDASGREYWSNWLFPRKATEAAADQLAGLLAAHIMRSNEEYEPFRKMIAAALAPLAGRPAREMIEHLVADPDTRRFVPASLRAFLEVEPAEPPVRVHTPSSAPAIPTQDGPLPVERDRVVKAMRQAVADGFDVLGTKNTSLEVMFDAKRTTTRDAKKVLKAEIAAGVAGVAARQTPVNGK